MIVICPACGDFAVLGKTQPGYGDLDSQKRILGGSTSVVVPLGIHGSSVRDGLSSCAMQISQVNTPSEEIMWELSGTNPSGLMFYTLCPPKCFRAGVPGPRVDSKRPLIGSLSL